jgi:CRP-like cAMP-binding protein
MTSSHSTAYDLMIRKLASIFPLSDEEKKALQVLPIQLATFKTDQDIVRVGERPSRSFMLVDGYTCVYKLTSEGRRQIVAFHVPGDMPDLHSLHLKVMDTSMATVTPCTIGFIPHEALHDLCAHYPRIAAALWRETLVDASIFREWMTGIGRRESYNRMAHLLCEFFTRLNAVGLTQDHGFTLPITQVELADAIGASTVHVNRVLQELRADGLIQTVGTQVNIPDWERLKEVADFDPLYLHLRQDAAA